MIVAITPKWKFVCERCGKEKFPKDDGYMDTENTCEIAVAISFLIDHQLMPKKSKYAESAVTNLKLFGRISKTV